MKINIAFSGSDEGRVMSETCSVELEYLIGWCGGGKSNGNNQRRCTGCRCIGGNRVERTEWRTCQ